MKKIYTTAFIAKRLLSIVILQLLFVQSHSQTTYTTIAPGNWEAPTTWAGGLIPTPFIAAGSVININHKVVMNIGGSYNINGTINITGDTLKLPSNMSEVITIKPTGVINITNGAITYAGTSPYSVEVDGGKMVLNNAYLSIGKDFISKNGGKRSFTNSKIVVGEKYIIDGTSSNKSYDTIRFTQMDVCSRVDGEFLIKSNGNVVVSNAYIHVQNTGDFKNESNGTITTVPGANGNFGFDFLRVTGELKNDGNWAARLDAACVGTVITGSKLNEIDFTRSQDCSGTPLIGAAPELYFGNPILVSGTDKKQGSVYRFNGVFPGVYAQIKLKKFSRTDIVVNSVDLTGMGWDKAFQPNFGLAGTAAPNQKWFIDFELKFYDSATNALKVMPKVDMTALDVDGDGVSIQEFANFQNPTSMTYSTLSSLVNSPLNLVGTSDTCVQDGLISTLIGCPTCGGDGKIGTWNLDDCPVCDASGLLHSACSHAYESVNANQTQGPVANFIDIDTAATQVMSVFTFTDRNVIRFRYGATTGASSSNAAMRLNSLWFRQFSLAPVIPVALPVKLESFTTELAYNNEKVNVRWTTGNEINVSHYIVERSTDAVHFSNIGKLAANGNTSATMNYLLTDDIKNVNSNLLYYRLKSVDADGKSQLSDIRLVRVNVGKNSSINILTFPNPMVNELRVTIPTNWQGKLVQFEIINSNGQILQRVIKGSSSQTEVLNASGLSTGMYIVKATCGTQSALQKVIKN